MTHKEVKFIKLKGAKVLCVESEEFNIIRRRMLSPCDECEEVDAEKDETDATHEDSNFLKHFIP